MIIAHRGASAYYPENTLPSFEGAISLGADMVELDVQFTADGEVVVFHDKRLNRCTDGRGRLGDYTLARLKKLDAGSWFHKKFTGVRVPLLAEVLELCKHKIPVNIEIKTEAVTDSLSGGIEEKCVALVDRAGMRNQVVYSSFDPRAVRHLKQMDCRIPAAVLYEKKHYGASPPSRIVEDLQADAFNCAGYRLSKKWREDLKQHGIRVNVYTVNREKDMKRMLELGVDGMFTNYPDVLKKVIRERKAQSVRGKE